MHPLEGNVNCPACGTASWFEQSPPLLPLRCLLRDGRYMIGRQTEQNGDGVTYLGYDSEGKKPVFVREFLPSAIAVRDEVSQFLAPMQGCEIAWQDCAQNFLELMRKLQQLRGLSALIAVTSVFEENGTIYAVFEYVEWMTLREFLLRGKTGSLSWVRARALLMPVLSTLGHLHSQGIIHRGISPNTLMFGADGKVRISGFSIWQARTAHGGLTAELSNGYAAFEQYGLDSKQGTWTDIYAFAAVLYRTITGTDPDDSVTRRHNDRVMVPAQIAERIPAYVINALINAMQVLPEDRTATVEQFHAELSASPSATAAASVSVQTPPPANKNVPAGNIKKKKKKKNSAGVIAFKTMAVIVGIGLVIAVGVLGYVYQDQLTAFFQDRLKAGDPSALAAVTTQTAAFAPQMPNLVGKVYSEALLAPYSAYFSEIVIENTNDPNIPKDQIMAQNIAEGIPLSSVKKQTLTLTLSLGPANKKLPNVVGKPLTEAQSTLEALGYTVSVKENKNDGTKTPGEVTEMLPAAGDLAQESSTVFLTVWGAAEN
jgi:serine/threonine-protein kinase